MVTGLVLDGSSFEVVSGADRIGPRRQVGARDQALLEEIAAHYVRGVHAHAADDVFVGLGRRLWSWLDGDQGQLTALLEQVEAPVVFEVRGPRSPSDAAWAVLRAPWEVLARPGGGFLAADAMSRFGVVRRLGAPGAVPAPDEHRLGLAFMASAPRQQRELDFEAEEAAILAAVDETRVDLVVEDTGNPVQFGRRLADLGGMPVVHLSCHGLNGWQERPGAPRVPALMMEDEVGDSLPTTAADLIKAMNEKPRLVFVSACLTATSADAPDHLPPGPDHRAAPSAVAATEGTVAHSLSTALIAAGIPAVLGWDGSVGDRAATLFAEELYRQLSNRADLAVAVGDARRRVLNTEDQRVRADWHLARLWAGPTGGGRLVGGTRRRNRVSAVHGTKVFLDQKEHVPVAAPEMFVGRRPELQRALRALRSPDRAGVLLHGQGRLGKSSLAARIADRNPQLIPAVVFGNYGAAAILDVIEQAVHAIPAARDLIDQRRAEVRERPSAFEPLLTDLLAGPLGRADAGQRALLLIIDDLEQILVPDPDGLHRVDPDVAPVLAAVLRAFDPAETDSRVLLTSRYQFTLDGLPNRLEQIPLRPLSLVARLKLLNRQQAQASPQLQTERSELAVRAAEVSRGNPGLQDLIGLRLVLSDTVAADRAAAVISDMETYLQQGDLPTEPQVRTFLENLALDTLLDLAGPEHRALLRDLTVFELPVPDQVVEVVAQRSGGSADRLRGLGLLDTFPDVHQPQQTAMAVNQLAKGRIAPLAEDEATALAILAVSPLFIAWGGEISDARSLPTDAELTRLALHAGNLQVTAACAAGAVYSLSSGPAAVAFHLGQTAIALLDQHKYSVPLRLLRRTADAARVSGDGPGALALFDRASRIDTSDDPHTEPLEHARVTTEYATYLFQRSDLDRAEQLSNQAHREFVAAGSDGEAASCQGIIADIIYQRGDYDEALRIRREVQLPVYERLGDTRSAAITWGQVADILFQRGDYDEALRIRREVELPVYERLGDTRSAAITWGQVADILFQRGDYDEALRIHREEALPVHERLGDTREAAITWGQIADILFRRGDYDEALRIRREVQLPVYERLGEIREIALTWGRVADILLGRGDYDQAAELHSRRVPSYEAMGDLDGLASAKWGLAQIEISRKNYVAAYPLLVESFSLLRQLQRPDGIAIVGSNLGQILFAAGQRDQAVTVFEISLEAARLVGQTMLCEHLTALIQRATEAD